MRCNELVGEQAGSIRNVLQDAVSEALDHAPALIILDDLDSLLPKEEGPEPATVVMALSEFLGDLMDLHQVGLPSLILYVPKEVHLELQVRLNVYLVAVLQCVSLNDLRTVFAIFILQF